MIGLAQDRQSCCVVGPTDDLQLPFHLRLALPDAEPSVDDGELEDGAGLVAAAALGAVGKPRLVDVKPGVEGLDRDQQIDRLDGARDLAAEIDQPISGIASERYECEGPIHHPNLVERLDDVSEKARLALPAELIGVNR